MKAVRRKKRQGVPQRAGPLRPAVFLDRDGTLVEERGHIRLCSEVRLLPGAEEALLRLQERFLLFIVTNQPGIAEGVLTLRDVEKVNAHLVRRLAAAGISIAEVYVCPHRRSDNCACIKPKPYFLRQASRSFGVDLARSFVIGDHPHDVELAASVGARGIYVLTGHGAKHLHDLREGTPVAGSIREAADLILADLTRHSRPSSCNRPAWAIGEAECGRGFRLNPAGDLLQVDPTAYVDPSAQLIGKVHIGPGVFVGPHAVLRADETGKDGRVSPIEIGAGSNIHDGVIIHALGGARVVVGPRTSLAHGAIIHGPCAIAGDCFVGFRAVLFDVRVAEGVFVGHGALLSFVTLPSHVAVPAGACITGETAGLPTTDAEQRQFMARVMKTNAALAEGYRRLMLAEKESGMLAETGLPRGGRST